MHEVLAFCLREGTEPILSRQAKRALLLVPSVPRERVSEVPIEGLRVNWFWSIKRSAGPCQAGACGTESNRRPACCSQSKGLGEGVAGLGSVTQSPFFGNLTIASWSQDGCCSISCQFFIQMRREGAAGTAALTYSVNTHQEFTACRALFWTLRINHEQDCQHPVPHGDVSLGRDRQ